MCLACTLSEACYYSTRSPFRTLRSANSASAFHHFLPFLTYDRPLPGRQTCWGQIPRLFLGVVHGLLSTSWCPGACPNDPRRMAGCTFGFMLKTLRNKRSDFKTRPHSLLSQLSILFVYICQGVHCEFHKNFWRVRKSGHSDWNFRCFICTFLTMFVDWLLRVYVEKLMITLALIWAEISPTGP